jgi:hypothetical protein
VLAERWSSAERHRRPASQGAPFALEQVAHDASRGMDCFPGTMLGPIALSLPPLESHRFRGRS